MKPTARSLIFLWILSSLQLVTARPNVVIFLADDQGWGDLSIHGNSNLSTPHIDSIGREGALFDRFFVCPVCAPTRAEFLTGRYYPRTGVRGVSTGQERLNADETTIADTFRSAGYATGAFGKWHNGSQHPYHPNARGFDDYYGFTSGHWGHYFDPFIEHNGVMTRGRGYIIDDLTDHAMKFIEKNTDKPFFCYLPYNTPHSPMQVPDRWWKKFADGSTVKMRHRDPELENPPHLQAALAMCENIDWNVGRVLRKLEDLGLSENTIVIYFSDNGPNGWRWNGGMKGRKGSIDEGGVRSPFLIRWPGKIRPGTRIDRIAGAIDLLPTLGDLCGVPLVGKKVLDGRSLEPLLLGERPDWSDRHLLSFKGARRKDGPQVSVRGQRFRLDAAGQLFDMKDDPGQRTDVAAEHPELVEELKGVAREFLAEVKDQIGPDDRPFPVGHSTSTPLPARDGLEHGGVRRSGRAPNCSYFTNWTSREDRITWDVEVAEAGTYDVVIWYACPKEDVGARFELSHNDSKLTATVAEGHDPPAYGAEADRTPDRGNESYVKDFRPMHFGTIDLAEGRGELTLRGLEIPGRQVMELRLLFLNRK